MKNSRCSLQFVMKHLFITHPKFVLIGGWKIKILKKVAHDSMSNF